MQEAYIVSALRTPVAKIRGAFKFVRPDDLLAHIINANLAQVPHIPRDKIDDVIIGCAMPEGAQGMNVARIGVLLANLPVNVPGVTVNRFCSSGLQTIAMACDRIRLGEADVIIAGGTESMSMVPMGGYHFEANPLFFLEDKTHQAIAYSMGITAEKVAQVWQINREQQDEFSFQSHQKALTAIEKAWFKSEISPIKVSENFPNLNKEEISVKEKIVMNDEGPRSETSLQLLSQLKPVFAAKGTVTAGNSSQMSDGAGAVIVVSEKALKAYNLQPIARLHAFSVAGVEPEHMGIGPIKAIPMCLKRAGLSLEDMAWIELNEAFAAQSLAVIKELNLDPSKVNPQGGAIALGHPLGATGAIRAATLIHGLKRIKQRYGMVTMCIGTGMGACGIFEVL